jgi:hypothetical protein
LRLQVLLEPADRAVRYRSQQHGIGKQNQERLVAGVVSSAVASSRFTGNGVLIRNKKLDQEVVEPIESFVANIVRALRNAHHGYLTANGPANRPARYLSLVSEHLPEGASILASFWVWADVMSTEAMFDRPWMHICGFEA